MRPNQRHPDDPRYKATQLAEVLATQGRRNLWVAEVLGVSRGQATHIIRGNRTIAERDARSLATVLGVPLSVLFELADTSDTLASQEGAVA